jgi:hypothetical protein
VSIGFRMKGSLDRAPPDICLCDLCVARISIWFYRQDEYVTNATLGLNST